MSHYFEELYGSFIPTSSPRQEWVVSFLDSLALPLAQDKSVWCALSFLDSLSPHLAQDRSGWCLSGIA